MTSQDEKAPDDLEVTQPNLSTEDANIDKHVTISEPSGINGSEQMTAEGDIEGMETKKKKRKSRKSASKRGIVSWPVLGAEVN